jgi:hypothetical protein
MTKGCFVMGLLLLSTVAQAKIAPIEPPRLSPTVGETAMYTGPAGAMLESDYFRAPQTPTASGSIFPCRMKLQYFEKTQIAQTCQ